MNENPIKPTHHNGAEPIVILRGSDPLAASIIRIYCVNVQRHVPANQITDLMAHADKMEAWPKEPLALNAIATTADELKIILGFEEVPKVPITTGVPSVEDLGGTSTPGPNVPTIPSPMIPDSKAQPAAPPQTGTISHTATLVPSIPTPPVPPNPLAAQAVKPQQ